MVLATLLLVLTAPARSARIFDDWSFFIGEPHSHTGVSGDGEASDLEGGCAHPCGALVEVLDTAVRNGLDWVAFPDHVNANHAADAIVWSEFQAFLLAHDDRTPPLVIPAAELVLLTPDGALGHKNLYFFGPDEVLSQLTMSDLQPAGSASSSITDCAFLGDWMDGVAAQWGPVLLIPHHPRPASPMPNDWSCFHEEYEVAVEIYSSKGNSLGGGVAFDEPPLGAEESGAVHRGMDPDGHARRLGFWGGTDDHSTRPGNLCVDPGGEDRLTGGLTIAVVPLEQPLDRNALLDAFVERRTIATSGPFLPFTVGYSSGDGSLGTLGQDLVLPLGRDLDVTVSMPEEDAVHVTRVLLVDPASTHELTAGDGGTWTGRLAADGMPAWVYPAVEVDGISWYGRDRCEDGGADAQEWLWGSPSWITLAAQGDSGNSGDSADTGSPRGAQAPEECGCGRGGAPGGLFAFALLPPLARRRWPSGSMGR